MLAHEASYTTTFGSEHDRDPFAEIQFGQRLRCPFIETANPKLRFFEAIDSSNKIHHSDERHGLERARGSLCEGSGHRWRTVGRQNDANGSKCRGGTQHGTDILRVGQAVQHDHDRRAFPHPGVPQYFLKIGFCQRFDFER